MYLMGYTENERQLAEKIASAPKYENVSMYGFAETDIFKSNVEEAGIEVPLEEITDGVRDAFNDVIASRWSAAAKPQNGKEMIERGFFVRRTKGGN